jgi:uncharacterized membrane protein YobD (UPF0266 family)
MKKKRTGSQITDWLAAALGVVILYFFFLMSCALDDACSAVHMVPLQ